MTWENIDAHLRTISILKQMGITFNTMYMGMVQI